MKPKLVFKAPVLTASGYGTHSRQLLQALLAADAFDITVIPIPWGNTPFVHGEDPLVKTIYRLAQKGNAEMKYDVSIQVTIPNEFQKLAKINIGVTAGIEVDRASPAWLQACNQNVDYVIVPSEHSLKTLAQVRYNSEKGVLQLEKSCAIAYEGFDERVFNTNPADPEDLALFDIGPEFNFLAVGLGFDKPMGEDRKNFSHLVKWFCETFRDDPKTGLVLKTSLVGNSMLDFVTVQRRIREIKQITGCGKFPEIKLIHGRLSDKQLAALYKHPKVKALVSLTHGEGFGLPLLEAAACGLPVVATAWSGHLDFLNIEGRKKYVSVEFDMAEVPASCVWNGVIERGSQWANPREEDAKLKLKKVRLSYDKPKEWATELAAHLAKNFRQSVTGFKFVNLVAECVNRSSLALASTPQEFAKRIRRELGIENTKSLLYTMPMSAGDVFISTAVVDSLRKKYPDHRIFFGVMPQYAEILKGNPNIDQLLQYAPWMQDVPVCEMIFDEVFTPNLAIQTNTANWVRRGKGRRLGDEMAAQCNVDFGEYFIETQEVEGLPKKYIVVNPGSGKGQWEARNYLHWQEVVTNIANCTGWPVLQVGLEGDPLLKGVTDLRGRTNYHQLAGVISRASGVVGIDSFTMHLAAAFGVPNVALFGSSYANSTGPVSKEGTKLTVLMETPDRYGCDRACYKYQCAVDRDHPCINEISPRDVVKSFLDLVLDPVEQVGIYQEIRPKIAGYTTVLNGISQAFPYLQSIKSMLGFCDEVVVVDGGSKDGTLENLKLLAESDPRVKVYEREWDWNEPGMDGLQKAFARAMVSEGMDFLWQQDADEVVHEQDYEKIKKLVKRFPADTILLHLPVVELWGSASNVRTDRHSWKWRLSRNDFRITHGINKDARVVREDGKTYAKPGMSDGCEYIDIMTGEFIPHKGFYSAELDQLRVQNPDEYGRRMNQIFTELPSVYHYSWADIPRKIRNFKEFWNRCWANLYCDPASDRFPEVKDEESLKKKAAELYLRGGEHGAAHTFPLALSNPAVMAEWLGKPGVINAHGPADHHEEQTGTST